jgi:hypothetical protein
MYMVSMVWYGMVWYGMVWYGMVWFGMVCMVCTIRGKITFSLDTKRYGNLYYLLVL